MEENKEAIVVEEATEEVKEAFGQKVKNFGQMALGKAKAGIESVKRDPEKLVAGIGVAGTAVLVALGIRAQQKLDRTVYDDETGECVELRRKLKNKDKIELAERMETEDVCKTTALHEMNLIK